MCECTHPLFASGNIVEDLRRKKVSDEIKKKKTGDFFSAGRKKFPKKNNQSPAVEKSKIFIHKL